MAATPRTFPPPFHPHLQLGVNLAERWFSALTTKELRRGAHRSTKQLAADILDWVERWNEDPKPFIWHKTSEEILASIARYCGEIIQTIPTDQ